MNYKILVFVALFFFPLFIAKAEADPQVVWASQEIAWAFFKGFFTGFWIILKVGWPYILGLIVLKLLIRYFEKKYPKKKGKK